MTQHIAYHVYVADTLAFVLHLHCSSGPISDSPPYQTLFPLFSCFLVQKHPCFSSYFCSARLSLLLTSSLANLFSLCSAISEAWRALSVSRRILSLCSWAHGDTQTLPPRVLQCVKYLESEHTVLCIRSRCRKIYHIKLYTSRTRLVYVGPA